MKNACVIAMIAAAALAACHPASTDGGPWVGTTETHGDTTVVTTIRGGEWGLPGPIVLDSVQVLWDGGDFHRVSAMAVGPDGVIYAAEMKQVDVVNPDGTPRAPIGRPGEGPGEFNSIAGVYAGADDSLLVWDAPLMRLTLFGKDGRVVNTRTLTSPGVRQMALNAQLFPAPEGLPLVWSRGVIAVDAPPDTLSLQLAESRGDASSWRLLTRLSDIRYIHAGTMVGPGYPFLEKPLTAIGPGGRFATGQGAAYQVDIGSVSSNHWTRVVRQVEPVPVPANIDRIPAAVLERIPANFRQSLKHLVESSTYGKFRNRMNELAFDDVGRLWVRVTTPADTLNPMLDHWVPEGRAPRYLWDLFASDGHRLGAIALPSRFAPRAFRKGVVYGIYEEVDGNNAVARVVLPEGAR